MEEIVRHPAPFIRSRLADCLSCTVEIAASFRKLGLNPMQAGRFNYGAFRGHNQCFKQVAN